MIHGPGNKGNLNLLYKFVKEGIPYPLAAYDNKRSFLSVQNLCFVIGKIIAQNVPSGIYNLADDEPLSTNDLVTQIALTLERKPKLWHVSKNAIKLLAIIGDKLHLPLNTELLHKLTENFVVSNFKIKTAINESLPVTSKEGIKITIHSFQN